MSGLMLSLFMIAPLANSSVLDSAIGVETTYAAESATFSDSWRQDATGNWHVYDNSGNMITVNAP